MDVPTRANLYVKVEERMNINRCQHKIYTYGDQDCNMERMNINRCQHKIYTYEDQDCIMEFSRYTFPGKKFMDINPRKYEQLSWIMT